MSDATFSIAFRRRPWWAWLAAVAWLGAMVLLVQTAVASGAEEEPRAAAISWVLAVALLIAGLAMWRGRRQGAPRAPVAAGAAGAPREGHDEP